MVHIHHIYIDNKRSFSNIFYNRLAPNSEKVKRRWYYCTLRKTTVFTVFVVNYSAQHVPINLYQIKAEIVTGGIGTILTRHKTSSNHLKCYERWVEAERRLSTSKTIDNRNQRMIAQDKEHWQNGDFLPLRNFLLSTKWRSEEQVKPITKKRTGTI